MSVDFISYNMLYYIYKINTKEDDAVKKKYIHLKRKDIYAIYYRNKRTICYNKDFTGTSKVIILKAG